MQTTPSRRILQGIKMEEEEEEEPVAPLTARMKITPGRRMLQGIKMEEEEEEPVVPFTPRRSSRLAQKAIVKITMEKAQKN